jgi:HTH-type transcriptional regulator/antitoxin HipB
MESIVRTATLLGAALRRRRRSLLLSQAALGERIHLRQATISTLEAGTSDARISTLMDALAALDLEIVVRPRSTAAPTDEALD